jgi:hypothetical protein
MTAVDFSYVPEKQLVIHDRLLNWGHWCHGSGHAQMSPMFRMYRSSEVYAYASEISLAVDTHDAARIAAGVRDLPEDHRRAVAWFYVNKGPVIRARKAIGCTGEHLARLVIDGRTMLINRRA